MKTEIWQNENGENLGTEELKVVSSKWTLEEWEHYQANGLNWAESDVTMKTKWNAENEREQTCEKQWSHRNSNMIYANV